MNGLAGVLRKFGRSIGMALLACAYPALSFAATQNLWSLAAADGRLKAVAPWIHVLYVDPAALSSLVVSDSGFIALPSGNTYEATTVRIEEHANGDRSWVGKFESDGKVYTSVLTFGVAGMVGSVRTPEGLFQLRNEGGRAVLVDVRGAGGNDVPLVDDARFPSPNSTPLSPENAAGERSVGLKDTAAVAVATTIDVLIGYTDGFVQAHNNQAGALLRINNLLATTNQAYVDSQVDITLRLAYATQVTYPDNTMLDAALTDLSTGNGAVVTSLRSTLRNRYGADMVVLLRRYTLNQGGCGLADVGGFGNNGVNIQNQPNSYAVVFDGQVDLGGGAFSYCAEGTLAHELGHNMGALHDAATNANESQGGPVAVGAYPYSYGYVSPTAVFGGGFNQCPNNSSTCFGTIMAYVVQYIAETLRFSNPNVSTCGPNAVCGTANANVALTLNNTRAGVSSWRATALPFKLNTSTGSGQTVAPLQAFAQPLKAIVLNQTSSAPVQGVTVTFSAPGAGALAILSAATAVTDVNGIAQVTATANAIPGTYQVTATANPGFVTSAFSFTLTNGAATPILTAAKAGTGTGIVTGSGASLINCGVLCASPPLPAGTPITLTGTPAVGSTLTGWLGAPGCPGNTPCTVTLNSNLTVTATFAPSATLVPPGVFPSKVDPDLNGSSEALKDGLIILRHLFGLTGSPLTANALGNGATRNDPVQITAFLTNIQPQLDIDGDGRADALTDGILYIRYLFGLRGGALIGGGAVAAGATRTTSPQIEAYIASIIN